MSFFSTKNQLLAEFQLLTVLAVQCLSVRDQAFMQTVQARVMAKRHARKLALVPTPEAFRQLCQTEMWGYLKPVSASEKRAEQARLKKLTNVLKPVRPLAPKPSPPKPSVDSLGLFSGNNPQIEPNRGQLMGFLTRYWGGEKNEDYRTIGRLLQAPQQELTYVQLTEALPILRTFVQHRLLTPLPERTQSKVHDGLKLHADHRRWLGYWQAHYFPSGIMRFVFLCLLAAAVAVEGLGIALLAYVGLLGVFASTLVASQLLSFAVPVLQWCALQPVSPLALGIMLGVMAWVACFSVRNLLEPGSGRQLFVMSLQGSLAFPGIRFVSVETRLALQTPFVKQSLRARVRLYVSHVLDLRRMAEVLLSAPFMLLHKFSKFLHASLQARQLNSFDSLASTSQRPVHWSLQLWCATLNFFFEVLKTPLILLQPVNWVVQIIVNVLSLILSDEEAFQSLTPDEDSLKKKIQAQHDPKEEARQAEQRQAQKLNEHTKKSQAYLNVDQRIGSVELVKSQSLVACLMASEDIQLLKKIKGVEHDSEAFESLKKQVKQLRNPWRARVNLVNHLNGFFQQLKKASCFVFQLPKSTVPQAVDQSLKQVADKLFCLADQLELVQLDVLHMSLDHIALLKLQLKQIEHDQKILLSTLKQVKMKLSHVDKVLRAQFPEPKLSTKQKAISKRSPKKKKIIIKPDKTTIFQSNEQRVHSSGARLNTVLAAHSKFDAVVNKRGCAKAANTLRSETQGYVKILQKVVADHKEIPEQLLATVEQHLDKLESYLKPSKS